MTASLPERSQVYRDDTTNSDIWARFDLRAGDIFICTPPKCGTTWMQSICGMLVFGDAGVNPGIGTISAWVDSKFNEEDELFARLGAQSHRRYLKTHTPIDGITYDAGASYVVVYRHPLDVAFSVLNHVRNMASGAFDDMISDDDNDNLRNWITQEFTPDDDMGGSLASVVAHYKSFLAWRHLPNVHLFHYADMTRDLRGNVARLADHLGIDTAPDLITAIADAATFSNMKSKAETYAPNADRGIWKDNAQFFESGSSNKWEGVLSDDVLALYEERISSMLGAADRKWLEFGD